MNKFVRKLFSLMRSMKLGIGILIVILLLCFVGTVIPQGQSAEYYLDTYPSTGSLLVTLQMDHLFSTWYFIAIFALLCVNLIFCSITRVKNTGKAKKMLEERARKGETNFPATLEAIQQNFSASYTPDSVHFRNLPGLVGSFLTHLGLLILLIAGGCVLTLQQNYDYTILPGNCVTLPDDTLMQVDNFTMSDADDRVDYVSDITVLRPNGEHIATQVSVNHPAHFGNWSVYQQNYSYAVDLYVKNGEDDPGQNVTLDDEAFLSLDGETGLCYYTMYPDYITGEDGSIAPISTNDGKVKNAVYVVQIINKDESHIEYAFPGSAYTIDGVMYILGYPVAYPGLLVKSLPGAFLYLLYFSFILLLCGLYLCFFCPCSAMHVRSDGLCVVSAKDTDAALDALRDRFALSGNSDSVSSKTTTT